MLLIGGGKMKRILALFLLCLMLISCRADTVGKPFLPFTGATEVTVNATCEGESSQYIYRSDGSIEFVSPKELSGYIMRISSDGAVTLSYEEMSIPLSSYAGRLLKATRQALTPSEADIVSIEAEGAGADALTVVKTDGWTYRFLSDGTPLSVFGAFDGVSLTLDIVSVTGE